VRVLVTGASGFIGRAVAEALLRAGHDVVCASRRPAPARPGSREEPLAVDMSQVPRADWWEHRLAGVHAVVNAVGILRERGAETFKALHTEAPIELFKACAAMQVLVVQVSALGADESAVSRYHLSKNAADDFLRELPVRSAIVQPSLVYGAGGSSAKLFNQLAAMPVLAFPHAGAMQVQPVHVQDVVAGIVALIEAPPERTATLAFVGPEALSMRDYLARLRKALGIGAPLRMWPLPESWFRLGARVAGVLPGSFLDSETAAMLLRGNTAPSDAFQALLRRTPLPVERFIAPHEAAALRTEAKLDVWLPMLRVSIALLWIWTGIVSLGLYPVQDSLALLARVGLHGTAATIALYGAGVLDLALGVLTLAAPARWRGWVWGSQVVLIGGYTVLITIFLPEYWLHPYGPITKNLPVLAAIGLLWALEPDPPSRA
jgi:uncharacterized protein YbjT (DUF2867 family)